MRYADKSGVVARVAKRSCNMFVAVAQFETSIGQTELAATVRDLSGEQSGAAGGTGRGGAKCVGERDALLCEFLNVWSRNGVAVGLHIASGIVRMHVDDVGSLHNRFVLWC